MNQCSVCQAELPAEQRGNITVEQDGIHIFIAGTPFTPCECGSVILPAAVKELVAEYVAEKKRIGGEPSLYLNIPDLLPNL